MHVITICLGYGPAPKILLRLVPFESLGCDPTARSRAVLPLACLGFDPTTVQIDRNF